jgi:hypothetical protein
MKTAWKDTFDQTEILYFDDLAIKDSYSIVNGRGAVYTKVYDPIADEYKQLELETGKLFPPTEGRVKREDVRTKVFSKVRPKLYRR